MTSYNDPSGQFLAQQAHHAGAVQPVVEQPLFDVSLTFVVRGSLDDARAIGHDLADTATLLHVVEAPVSLSIVERRAV